MSGTKTAKKGNLIALASIIVFSNIMYLVTKKDIGINFLFLIAVITSSIIEFNLIKKLKLQNCHRRIAIACATFILIASLLYIYRLVVILNYVNVNKNHLFHVETALITYKNYNICNLIYEINKVSSVLIVLLNGFLIMYKPEIEISEKRKIKFFSYKNIPLVLIVVMIFISIVTYQLKKSEKIEIDFSSRSKDYFTTALPYSDGTTYYTLLLGEHPYYYDYSVIEISNQTQLKRCIVYELFDSAHGDVAVYLENDGNIPLEDIEIVEGKLDNMKKGETVTFKLKGDMYDACEKYGVVFKNNSFTVTAGEHDNKGQ